jgi:mono/diheme cytochrome c family protein
MASLAACSGSDTSDSSTAASGASLYRQSCASCHGSDLRGTDQGPSHLSEVYAPSHHSDDSFRAAITRGSPAHHWDFGDMKPVVGLDDDEIDAILTFIREQQDEHGFEPYPPR